MANTHTARITSPSVHSTPALPSPAHAAARIERLISSHLSMAQQMWSLAQSTEFKAVKDGISVTRKVRDAAQDTRKAGEAANALAMAPRHMRAVAQMSSDVAKMRREIAYAEDAASYFRSDAAASALVFMRPAYQSANAAVQNERAVLNGYLQIARDYSSNSSSAIGKIGLGIEDVMQRSSIGRGMLQTGGKIVSNRYIKYGMDAVGVASAAYKGYENSIGRSTRDKLGSAVLTGAMSFATDKAIKAAVATGRANPSAVLFDPAIKYTGKMVGFDGEKYTFGKWSEGTANVLAGVTSSILSQDARALDEVHQRNIQGANGAVLQGWAMIGETIAKSSLMDAALTKAADWVNGVPSDISTSKTWWAAITE